MHIVEYSSQPPLPAFRSRSVDRQPHPLALQHLNMPGITLRLAPAASCPPRPGLMSRARAFCGLSHSTGEGTPQTAAAASATAAAAAVTADTVQAAWAPGSESDPRAMFASLLAHCGGLRLRLVEGPGAAAKSISFTPEMPFIRPGLYSGAYGAHYGQHRIETLLVEYQRSGSERGARPNSLNAQLLAAQVLHHSRRPRRVGGIGSPCRAFAAWCLGTDLARGFRCAARPAPVPAPPARGGRHRRRCLERR